MTLRRPALRWFGGKWKLAPWIIDHFPPHNIYVEAFGGGASVLLRKERSYAEVYNDLDSEVVNFFRVLRDPEDAKKLLRAIHLTPFSRQDYVESHTPAPRRDTIERARRLATRAYMGFGSNSGSDDKPSGFRQSSNRQGTTAATDWAAYPASLLNVIERFRGVTIEQRDAVKVMATHDGPETLHYVDPPYVHSTRSMRHRESYRHEMTDKDHARLAEFLRSAEGMVVISGYENDLYAQLYHGWTKEHCRTNAFNSKPAIETIWLNPRASAFSQIPLI
jgi:DNA adenine methylase